MDACSLTAISVAIANALAEQVSEKELIVLSTLLSMIGGTLDAIIRIKELNTDSQSSLSAEATAPDDLFANL